MIREGTRGDIPRCAEIIADSLLWRTYDRTLEDAVAAIEGSFPPDSRMWVSESGGIVTGFVIAYERGMFGDYGYIRLIGVDAARRGAGVGSRLLAAAEEHLFALRPWVFLTVSEFNTDAQRLYSRRGYERIGAIPDYRRPGIAEFMLMKRRDRE